MIAEYFQLWIAGNFIETHTLFFHIPRNQKEIGAVDLRSTLNITWNSELRAIAQEVVSSTPHIDVCYKFDRTPFGQVTS